MVDGTLVKGFFKRYCRLIESGAPTALHTVNKSLAIQPELKRLLEPGVLGSYEWFELLEIGCSDGRDFLNVFSICVAVEGTPTVAQASGAFLNGPDRKVPGIANRMFGIRRKYIRIEALFSASERFDDDGKWQPHDEPLSHGTLEASAPAFYAPDGTHPVPLNRLLKNNFWNGSHVIELADATKASLTFPSGNPQAIEALGVWTRQFIPIDIASVAGRIGNVLIQIPVTSIVTDFLRLPPDFIGVTVAWHPDVAPRNISGSVEVYFDETVVAYGQQQLKEGDNPIVRDTTNRPFRGLVWDTEKNLLLAANPVTVFVSQIHISGSVNDPSFARVFHEPQKDAAPIRNTIPLERPDRTSMVGSAPSRPNGTWTERRISDTEIQALVKSKQFIQYGGTTRRESEHRRALEDIRWLLNMHGRHAVYVWDPYLSSGDILATLFHSKHPDSKLRALTSARALRIHTKEEQIPHDASEGRRVESARATGGEDDVSARARWMAEQCQALSDSLEGPAHIRLEFRMSFGPRGWGFHDRFLIFPQAHDTAPRVWSLGSSINQLGASHAIVQQVAHPQPVLDAFEELWSAIGFDEHLIWASAS